MLTNYKVILKTGLIVLALSVGACGSSSNGTGSGGKGGSGGASGSGGAAGGTAGGGVAGSGGTTGAAGTDGGAGSQGVGGTDGGAMTEAGSDTGEAGAQTPEQIHDNLINGAPAPGTTAIPITRAAPKVYSNGTCQ